MDKKEKKQGILKKSNANACLNDKMELSLPLEDVSKYRTGLIGILISNIYETENASHANGGPRPVIGVTLESVDYKGCEHSKLVLSEFHHITSAVLYKMKRASLLKRSTLLFCKSQKGLKTTSP